MNEKPFSTNGKNLGGSSFATFNTTTDTSSVGGAFALNAETMAQYLTFQLEDGVYALGIELIREIRGVTAVSPLPGSPAYVRGIMNLRGAIIPVIDLRIRLGLRPASNTNRFAVTIITEHDTKRIGLLADAVHEVVRIPESSMQKSFSLLEHGDQRFIQSLALLPSSKKQTDIEEPFIVILNLDRLYDPALEVSAESIAALHNHLAEERAETPVHHTYPKETPTRLTDVGGHSHARASALPSEMDPIS